MPNVEGINLTYAPVPAYASDNYECDINPVRCFLGAFSLLVLPAHPSHLRSRNFRMSASSLFLCTATVQSLLA